MDVPDKFKKYPYKNGPNYSQRPNKIRFCEHADGSVLLPEADEVYVGTIGSLNTLIQQAVVTLETLSWSVSGGSGTVQLAIAPTTPEQVLFFMYSGAVYRGTIQVSIVGDICTIDANSYGVTDNEPVLVLHL